MGGLLLLLISRPGRPRSAGSAAADRASERYARRNGKAVAKLGSKVTDGC